MGRCQTRPALLGFELHWIRTAVRLIAKVSLYLRLSHPNICRLLQVRTGLMVQGKLLK